MEKGFIPHDDSKCHVDLRQGTECGRDTPEAGKIVAIAVSEIARGELNESIVNIAMGRGLYEAI